MGTDGLSAVIFGSGDGLASDRVGPGPVLFHGGGAVQEEIGPQARTPLLRVELSGLSGTLYLDTYDETKTNPMYTFKPRG